jgi:hypothetical protein
MRVEARRVAVFVRSRLHTEGEKPIRLSQSHLEMLDGTHIRAPRVA